MPGAYVESRRMKIETIAILALLPVFAQAQNQVTSEIRRPPPPPESSLHQQHDVVTGTVNAVQNDAGKITITHQSFASLGVPATTTVFRVKPPSMLKRLHSGQKVKFVAERIDGEPTITWMVPIQ